MKALAAVAILAAVLPSASFSETDVSNSRLTNDEMTLFLSHCENLISDRLLDPGSYLRIDTSKLRSDPGSMLDYMGETIPEIIEQHKEDARISPSIRGVRLESGKRFLQGGYERISIDITYQASDATGKLVDMTSECSQYIHSRSPWSLYNSESDIRIDGYDWLDWLTHEVNGGKKLPLSN